jgi:BLOC-1 related complex subunit 6
MNQQEEVAITSINQQQQAKKIIEIVDASAIRDIDTEASIVSKEFYQLALEMKHLLNQISATSVCCIQTYKDSAEKLFDSIDINMEAEKQMIDKAQELSSKMKPIYELQSKVANIKRALDQLDSQI